MIIGIGIDAVSIKRMSDGKLTSHVLTRMFHQDELEEASLLTESGRAQYLASRFAAKEAFGKALGCGLCGVVPSEVAVVNDCHGKPGLQLYGSTERMFNETAPGCRVLISITHEDPLAIAQVILVREDS